MSEEFDYIKNISALTLEQKRKFYVLFAHDLTVSVRAIGYDENFTDAEKVEGMKLINELMHRLIFRIEELHTISKLKDDSWTEGDFWKLIIDYCSDNPKVVSGNVGWAIKSSYKRCFSV